MAKKGELPPFFRRKLWLEGKEGLLITSGLVIALIFFLNLSNIVMMGSAAFLLIYTGVNLAHLKLCKETRAHRSIIYLAILGCMFSFSVLAYYELFHSPLTIVVLAGAVLFSFSFEAMYRKISRRKFKIRTINQ
jgi:hypothetical protein